MRRYPRRVKDLLSRNPQVSNLLKELSQQQTLLKTVLTLLPPPLDQHCLAVQLKERKMLIYTDSSAWASRLRFHSRELSRDLATNGVPIQKITVRVSPQSPGRRTAPRRMNSLSPENARIIRQTAEDICDPGLSAALSRLARKTR